MPRIDELIDRLGRAKVITTLDLSKGYWQVPVAAVDRVKTAFSSPYGLFQFTVMPFGLQGAPATFQQMMDELLRGTEGYSAAYLDDIVIYSDDWKDHMKHLKDVFRRLRKAGLTVKLDKCQFGMEQCLYLGHMVGNGTVRPENSKLEALKDFPIPRTKMTLREFLGDSGTIVRSHQEDSSKGGPVECRVWKGIQEVKIVAVWGASAEMPRFRETLCIADRCFRLRSGSCLESNV